MHLKWAVIVTAHTVCVNSNTQYLAGHENSKTTMDIYARVKYNKPEELFEVVNDALNQENFDEKSPISMVKE